MEVVVSTRLSRCSCIPQATPVLVAPGNVIDVGQSNVWPRHRQRSFPLAPTKGSVFGCLSGVCVCVCEWQQEVMSNTTFSYQSRSSRTF